MQFQFNSCCVTWFSPPQVAWSLVVAQGRESAGHWRMWWDCMRCPFTAEVIQQHPRTAGPLV